MARRMTNATVTVIRVLTMKLLVVHRWVLMVAAHMGRVPAFDAFLAAT